MDKNNIENQFNDMCNDIAKYCPALSENCCGDTSCVSCLTIFLYNAGYRKQEWHKVSEEIPKTSGLYIVCTDKGSVCTAHYYADCGRFNAPFRKSVVWWTDFPEPPKGADFYE